MPHISSKQLNESVEKEIKNKLFIAIRKIGKDSRATHALSELLTHTEVIMLSKRLSIIYLLLKDKSINNISRELNVSTSTIMKITKKLDKNGYQNLQKIFRKMEPSVTDIVEIILKAGLPPRGKGRWSFLDDNV